MTGVTGSLTDCQNRIPPLTAYSSIYLSALYHNYWLVVAVFAVPDFVVVVFVVAAVFVVVVLFCCCNCCCCCGVC